MKKSIIEAAFTWIISIFEDQTGSASSKRFVLFICMFYLHMLIKASIELAKIGKTIDMNVLATVGGIILFLIGAVTSEFFKKTL